MVDRALLARKARLLREQLQTLRAISGVALDEYLSDPRVYGSVERFLQLAAECALDIAAHVVADEGLGSPETYREVFAILRDAGRMEPELAGKMQDWAGFRNVLVHLYEGLDHERCWRAAREDLGQLEDFLGWVAGQL